MTSDHFAGACGSVLIRLFSPAVYSGPTDEVAKSTVNGLVGTWVTSRYRLVLKAHCLGVRPLLFFTDL